MKHEAPSHPNIIVILTDDQGPWALGSAGNSEIRTPHLDRLAASGMRFDNFFCTSPVCSPARASLLTGRIPSRHGVHDWLRAGNTTVDHENRGLIEYLEGQPGYTDVLAREGYTCGLSGKWHMGDSHHPQKGFSYWAAYARGGGHYYRPVMIHSEEAIEESDYVTDIITDNALRFLDEQKENSAPFYLSVHYTAPHSPWEREEHPRELWDDYFENCPFRSVPRDPMHPWHVPSFRDVFASEPRRREFLAGYYAATTAMDAGVGRILDWIDAHAMRENTLVIFTSDNGMNMGHHGIIGKGNSTFPMNMYDSSVKVPAIISRPGQLPAGQIRDELLSHYDVFPTLLDYLGVENPEAQELPGRSFAPLLRGEPVEERGNVVVFDEYGPVRMIRNRQWKYVHRYLDGRHELYNLVEDPGEKVNRVDDPACRSIIRELTHELDTFFQTYADPPRDAAGINVLGGGQVDRVEKGDAAFRDHSDQENLHSRVRHGSRLSRSIRKPPGEPRSRSTLLRDSSP